MFYLTQNHPDSPGAWAVCEDGQVLQQFGSDRFAHARAVGALIQRDTDHWQNLVAAGDLLPWTSPAIAFLDTPTSDRRQLESSGLAFRAFPMPLMLQTVTAWGHDGAVIAGRIDSASANGSSLAAAGVWDSSDIGQEAARLAAEQMLTGVSVDISIQQVETEVIEVDDDGWVTDWLDHFTEWELMGATQTPFPAFADAKLVPGAAAAADEDDEEPVEEEDDDEPVDEETDDDGEAAVAAVVAAAPVQPPAAWFERPEIEGVIPWTVTDEGQVYGHIATWDMCHIGSPRPGTCTPPPRSDSGYAYYTTGAISCVEGCHIPIGVISMGTGHADLRNSAREAIAHYDNTGTGAADVAIGEDDFGIWVAGGARSTLTDEQMREFRACPPSGDWRIIEGKLEFVAALSVNVQGYPVARSRVAAGVPQALVAAGVPVPARSRPGAVPAWALAMQADNRRLRSQLEALTRSVGSVARQNLQERMLVSK